MQRIAEWIALLTLLFAPIASGSESPVDERSSLGLVRLRVKRATAEMGSIFESIDAKVTRENDFGGSIDSPFAEITEEDIDALFN